MSTRDKVQLNVSLEAKVAQRIRQLSTSEGRKIGDMIERILQSYAGEPSQLLDRLRRFKKSELSSTDRTALREMADYIAWLLYAPDDNQPDPAA